MLNGPVFLNETIQANARAVNAGGISESLDKANALYSRLSGASFELVPSSFRGGTLYSGVPGVSGDLTWTRASDAFRTNASGLIQRVPWNLVQQSETFENVYWAKLGTTVPTITVNATTAPNGTTTADLLSGTGGLGQRLQATFTVNLLSAYSVSVYVKANTSTTATINIFDAVTDRSVTLTFSTGAIVVSGSGVTGEAISLGNGWFRLIANYATFATTSINVQFSVSGSTSYFIWGAQFVEGTTAQTYLPTTDRLNFPRLSYMYGSCPSVLLEPQRTNTETWSEDFSNASWTKTNSSITANATTSPDGTQNADKIIENSVNGVHFVFNATATLSVVATLSVYAKADTRTQIALQLGANSVCYNLSDGTIVSGSGGSIQSVGNGWYRCSITQTPLNTNALIYIANSGSSSYQGNGTSGLFIYGAQMEVGAYPTTYIPTTSATATRVADSFIRNNIYTNGLITSSGGTWFVELRGNEAYTRDATNANLFLDTSNGGVTNGFSFLGGLSNNRIIILKYIGGATTSLYTTTTSTTKIAIKWNGTTADVFVNGTKQVSATAFTPTGMEFLNGSGAPIPLFIQQMALYPSALSDTDCISLTADYTDGTSIVGDYERYVNSNGGAVENLNGVTNLIQNLK